MSRDLPSRSNLDHLRKQAKALLHSMREQRPGATLADAQHAIAREYGFASWPKLKAHLEALPHLTGGGGGRGGGGGGAAASDDLPSPPLFPRFTEASRRALFFSRYEAAQAGRLRIRPDHVLLGVVRGASGATRTLLANAGVTLEQARAALIDPNEPREVIAEPVEIPFESSTRALFTAAALEADKLGHATIATTHVVLALVRGDSDAAAFLRDHGIGAERARAAAVAGRGEE